MKTRFTTFLGICAAVAMLSACDKKEDRAELTAGSAPTLTASTSSLVLQSENGAQTGATYTWTPVTFTWSSANAYQPAVTYVLQYAKAGTNFQTVAEIEAGTGTSRAVTVAELNTALLRLGLAPEAASQVETRLRATYSANQPAMYSSVGTLAATPYSTELYVPSSYQSNDPTTAEKIVEVAGSPRLYEGFMYFPAANGTFKFANARTTTARMYGDTGEGTTGKLATPGNNCKVPAAGYYQVKANLDSLKWSAVKTEWAIIGDATPGGWDNETKMTYDATKKVWTVRATLKAGKIKFRANNGWDINLGGAANNLSYGGSDITGPGAGAYTITLDLSKGAGSYTYSAASN